MADFIYFEAEDDEDIDINVVDLNEEEEESMIIDDDLIDDSQQENDSHNFHRFHNQTTDTSEIMEEILREEEAASELLEPNNYVTQNEIEDTSNEVYDETDFLKSKSTFLKSLINPIDQTVKKDTFYLTLLHAIRYAKHNKKDLCLEEDIEKEIGINLYSEIKAIKDSCIFRFEF